MKKDKLFPVKIVMTGIVTPTNNQILKWLSRGYFSNIKRIKKDYWNMLLMCGAHEDKYKAKKGEKRTAHIDSYRPRKIDKDNLIAGMKYLIDTLEKMGLIWSDSPKFFRAYYNQHTDRKNPRTEIVLAKDYLTPL